METRIYVADLACYNNGLLVGGWIDLPSIDIDEEIKEILEKGTEARKEAKVYDGVDSEEYAIHDSEAPFEIGEYDNVNKVNELAEAFEDYDDDDIKRYNFAKDHCGYSIEDALAKKDEVDFYEDTTLAQLAEQLVDDGVYGEVNPSLAYYIDYEAIGRDLGMDYTVVGNDIMRLD